MQIYRPFIEFSFSYRQRPVSINGFMIDIIFHDRSGIVICVVSILGLILKFLSVINRLTVLIFVSFFSVMNS
jgi:hypothetical protein